MHDLAGLLKNMNMHGFLGKYASDAPGCVVSLQLVAIVSNMQSYRQIYAQHSQESLTKKTWLFARSSNKECSKPDGSKNKNTPDVSCATSSRGCSLLAPQSCGRIVPAKEKFA